MSAQARFKLAIHSTHEAAHKIAGIGAVLDGVLPTTSYQRAFERTLLVGPYPLNPQSEARFAKDDWRTAFDSGARLPIDEALALPEAARRALHDLSASHGCRLIVGQRSIHDVWVDTLLTCPNGAQMRPIRHFEGEVEYRFGVNIRDFASWPAIRQGESRVLERVLLSDPRVQSAPDQPITDALHRELPGGVAVIDERARFPKIAALDAFQDFERANPYLIELQFYLYAAPALWAATRALMVEAWGIEGAATALFAHDWLGVPLFWASQLETRWGGVDCRPARTIYFAHEARYARLLVEGVLWDQRSALVATCHPDGHDVSFYAHLARRPIGGGLSAALPGVALDRIPYHLLNAQAGHFDRVLAVGDKVLEETRLMIGDGDKLKLCPNGVPTSSDGAWAPVEAAGQRLRRLAEVNLGFRPDQIFTSVSRCELSKAPWRNVALFEAYANRATAENPKATGLLLWLLRPRPLPTDEEARGWGARYGWPLRHELLDQGGDLRGDEWLLWQQIEAFNARWAKRFQILYINQFGWGADKLGALDPLDSKFTDLRLGTDVELALSIYEPFGISALEPFSAGAICVISDACGCAGHLKALSSGATPKIRPTGYLIAPFTQHNTPPQRVDLSVRAEIEQGVYAEVAEALWARLRQGERGRQARLAAAQAAMMHLSWETVARDYLLPGVGSPGLAS
ncbi:glycosyltransferase [Myxococcota bacterium]|nr:glycosyltransferase [Myxococcota bacterium]MBU1432849.1 glycosyltransferase [Myxococcota bacterium]MBU1897533.1 glycosyltransferase [Myxococcota bacterium]